MNPIINFLNSDVFSSGQMHAEYFTKFSELRKTANELSKNFTDSWLDVFESMLVGLQPHQLKDYREKLGKENLELLAKHNDKVARFQIFIEEKIAAIFVSGFICGNYLPSSREDKMDTGTVYMAECLDCHNKDFLIHSDGDGKISCSKCHSKNIKRWESATGDSIRGRIKNV